MRPSGCRAAELRMRLGGMHRRLDDAQGDRIHPDAALRILDCQRFGRGVQAALCQGCKHGRRAGDRVVDQACRDLHHMAAALLLHLGNGELGDVKETGDVDAHHRRVVSLGVLGERLPDEDAGVVDERVDAPEPRHAFGNRALGCLSVGDVAGDRDDIVIVRRPDRARGRDNPVIAVTIRLDERGADALRGTSNDSHFPFGAHFGNLPCSWEPRERGPSGGEFVSISAAFFCPRLSDR